MPFKTKICGVTTPEDAAMVSATEVDAIGLNFFEKSKRFVAETDAIEIVKQIPLSVKRVGVFVNASCESIYQIAKAVELDFVQLHGDEPPDFLSKLNDFDSTELQVIRAFRCKAGLEPVRDYLDACEHKPIAVLVDAYDPDEYGGTGKTIAWPDIATAAKFVGDLPLILAGGLTPANVSTAIQQASPYGVDTASGVEKTPQIAKDASLCRAFVKAANASFSAAK